ncbi:hypothetical protein I6N90_17125 [Paenibacillus sp. GSMTC-2017]|uniref:hypothetical protein n=1 Tax=Paenibacillus sp. GSMTC-2017 TaxID=2794350 RepID=UPI0018D6365B|nr:hypothetical protein [Paenibacillus sp. GSMTC-2017]MBH5319521.1 hypothetical protein [Paenibacillus sp. GSMTC-2017]
MTLNKNHDLKKLFHEAHIPTVDLTEKVMKKLYAEQNSKPKFMIKYKVSLLVAVAMLMTASTAFAMIQYQSIKNKQGEVVFETGPLNEAPRLTEDERQRWIKTRILGDAILKDGSAAFFYIVPHNPNMEIDLRNKPFLFTDVSALREKVTDKSVTIRDSLGENYTFKSAKVFFEPVALLNPQTPEEKAAIAEKLKKQAEQSKKDYAMLPLELSDRFFHLNTTYQKQKNEINVTINYSRGVPTAHYDEQMNIKQEKIQVNGVDMLYSVSNEGFKDLTWIVEIPGSKLNYLYNIVTSADDITKEDMKKIAESYMN